MPFALLAAIAAFTLAPGTTRTVDADPDLPSIFFNMVPDVCFSVVRGTPLSQVRASQLLLEPVPLPLDALAGRYPAVPQWYRSIRKPGSVLIGVGDAPGRCHVVLTNTTQGPAAFRFAEGLLRSTGFQAYIDPQGRAETIFGKHAPDGTMIVLLRGLTNAADGLGPQVSFDVALRADQTAKPAGSAARPRR